MTLRGTRIHSRPLCIILEKKCVMWITTSKNFLLIWSMMIFYLHDWWLIDDWWLMIDDWWLIDDWLIHDWRLMINDKWCSYFSNDGPYGLIFRHLMWVLRAPSYRPVPKVRGEYLPSFSVIPGNKANWIALCCHIRRKQRGSHCRLALVLFSKCICQSNQNQLDSIVFGLVSEFDFQGGIFAYQKPCGVEECRSLFASQQEHI